MNQKEITLLMAYILNNRTRLEDEKREIQSNIRFREADDVDCLELIKANQHLQAFKEITTDILHLLSLYPDDKKGGE